MESYVNNETLIESEISKLLKSSIICPLCKNILINPVICLICQNTYCKKCIDNWSLNNSNCPNKCDNPNYQKSLGKIDILSKLQFTCVGCGLEIPYLEAEKHHISCCPDKTSKDMNSHQTPKGPRLKKLKSEEVNNLKKEGNEVTYLTSKKKIFLLFFYSSYNFGLNSSGKIKFN